MMACTSANAQTQMVVNCADGSKLRIDIENIKDVTFEDVVADKYESVDLGLSVKWAAHNIGASAPEEYGSYFAWGETATKSSFTESNYVHNAQGSFASLGSSISATKYDAATAAWGGQWRTPTIAEVDELTSRCTWTWTSQNGVSGYRVTGPSGASIFLPAAGQKRGTDSIGTGSQGYYWSATQSTEYSTAAFNLNFTGYTGHWSANRSYGFPIRPVK